MEASLFHLKNRLLNFLTSQGMFFTIGLLSSVELSFTQKTPVACIGYCKAIKAFRCQVNPVVLTYDEMTQIFVLMHEIRHVLQVKNFQDHIDMIGWQNPNLPFSVKCQIANIATDIALNQDVCTLLSTVHKKTTHEVTEHVRKTIGGGCFIDDLQAALATEWIECLPDRDFVYYANKILSSEAGQSLNGFDEHDFGDAEGEAAAREACEKAQQIGDKLSRQAGKEASDALQTVSGHQSTTQRVKSLIRKLKVKAGVLGAVGYEYKKTWQKKNRKRDHIPGFTKKVIQAPGVVLVLDTSGSMWEETVLNALVGVGQELIAQKKLAAAYCCDTELRPLVLGATSKLGGGGGTIFDNSHIAQILEEHKAEEISVIYVTDECVDLDEVKSNKKVNLVVINILKELGRE